MRVSPNPRAPSTTDQVADGGAPGRHSTLAPRAARAFAGLLVVVHVVLVVVGVMGLAEWLLPAVPWPSISNPRFPPWMLLLAWVLILGAGCLFLVGYLRRWRHTPLAMAIVYASMGTVCAVQTFGFLVHESRFREMAIEYAEYTVILIFLFRSRSMRRHFGRGHAAAA